jgi:hypothetical protein
VDCKTLLYQYHDGWGGIAYTRLTCSHARRICRNVKLNHQVFGVQGSELGQIC